MALMTLNISALVSLAIPMIVILVTQALVMIIYAYFVTFRTMGKDYDAAVMAAGHCGVGLGQTPNAIANMSSVIEENGPAPEAWFTLPVVTVIFINIFNPVIITFFMTLFS
jgi:ESS family glutamate:Na+ symporter